MRKTPDVPELQIDLAALRVHGIGHELPTGDLLARIHARRPRIAFALLRDLRGLRDDETGARALRSIVEEIMLEIMYEVPSRSDIKVCHITQELVAKRSTAELLQLPSKAKLKGEIA